MFYLDRKLKFNTIGWRIFGGITVVLGTAAFLAGTITFILMHVLGWSILLQTITAACEVTGACCFTGYFATYISEFRHVSVEFVVQNEMRMLGAAESVRLI